MHVASAGSGRQRKTRLSLLPLSGCRALADFDHDETHAIMTTPVQAETPFATPMPSPPAWRRCVERRTGQWAQQTESPKVALAFAHAQVFRAFPRYGCPLKKLVGATCGRSSSRCKLCLNLSIAELFLAAYTGHLLACTSSGTTL